MHAKSLDGKLSLTNDGTLELCFIGTGSAFAKTLFQTNLFIIKGDTHILVDFGTTGSSALAAVGIEPTDVGVLLPTHSHCDHVGGVELISLLNRYVGVRILNKPKLRMLINEEYQEILWNMTLRGGMEFNEVNSDNTRLTFEDFYDITRPTLKSNDPREVWELNFNGIKLELFRTNHIPDDATSTKTAFITYGLFIDDRILFSGDTKFDPSLIELYGERAEYIFHDASLFPNPVHASLNELRTLPDHIKKKMYLMHYSDNWREVQVPDFAGYALQGMRYVLPNGKTKKPAKKTRK